MIGVMGAKEDILGQDEIDALMRGMGGVQVGEDDSVGRTDVVLYDFTNQERVVRGKFPALDVIAERFARCFQRRLIDMVQVGVEISSGEIKVLKMNEYLRNLSFPTSLNIIKIEVLGGLGLFAINSKLIFNAIDLYYGGNGQVHFKIEGREYTPVEVGFVKSLITECIECMEFAWESVLPIKIEMMHTEMNPKFASIVDPVEMVVIAPVKVKFESQEGQLDVVLPLALLEPIKDILEEGLRSSQGEAEKRWNKTLRDEAKDILVNVRSELTQIHLSMEDVLAMEVGDVIPFEMPDRALVTVEDMAIGHGRIGVYEGKKAIEMLDFNKHPAYTDRDVPLEW